MIRGDITAFDGFMIFGCEDRRLETMRRSRRGSRKTVAFSLVWLWNLPSSCSKFFANDCTIDKYRRFTSCISNASQIDTDTRLEKRCT